MVMEFHSVSQGPRWSRTMGATEPIDFEKSLTAPMDFDKNLILSMDFASFHAKILKMGVS